MTEVLTPAAPRPFVLALRPCDEATPVINDYISLRYVKSDDPGSKSEAKREARAFSGDTYVNCNACARIEAEHRMITVAAYDRHVEQLFELMRRLHAALTKAKVDYRIVGGMDVFFQVSERDPDAARLT